MHQVHANDAHASMVGLFGTFADVEFAVATKCLARMLVKGEQERPASLLGEHDVSIVSVD